ncbi:MULTISPECIES: helix-turn-helix domain-containing protein [Lactobacillus]|uniref:XRE family transcriptional regulator n=1 Tax=Lactobacillus xujianguonis TaxID=2495899 RepID=A0A437SSP1_9LACO|nr:MULTISPECIES: helix-turn-helix transcriptional regulator [Lactobacillus]RVU69877.1 XRE family transcriptional regulator [Lactobacillus xujianguonis]RVU73858.1 XRE family transcriptional regulator [Lactobacillus xujianguonis]
MVTVGQQLKRMRQKSGLSQQEMAAGIINSSFYPRVENDQSAISATSLIKLLTKYGISIIEFLHDFGNVELHNLYNERRISSAFLKQDRAELKEFKPILNLIIN